MALVSRRLAMLTFGVFSIIAIASMSALATQVERIDSKVTISKKAPAFHGRVKSDKQPCVEQRKVELFKARRHRPDKLLGKDHTNHQGRWEVDVNPLRPGGYYAKVTRRSEGTAGTIHICRPDRSKFVGVD